MKVTFIRHTRVGIPKGICYGWTDVPVADTFEEEAAVTLRNLGDNKFDKVYTSPLTRAVKLAEFCGHADAERDERLKEMNMGDWEMQKFDEIEDQDALNKWYDDYMHLAATNGESFPKLYSRVSSFLDELKTMPYKNVAVFAHGGVIICAGIYGGLFTADNCFQHLVDNGAIQTIEI